MSSQRGRPRKTPLDTMADAYMELDVADRAAWKHVQAGIDRATARHLRGSVVFEPKPNGASEIPLLEDLGERIAEEAEGAKQ